uniref:Rhodopsin domain-containing protein n=1 Tax=Bionectria ochroleuca TaxID=29856 RepID=A0A8H7TRK2_BIOOC
MAPESRGDQITGVAIFFLSLTTFASILRVYCRGWVIKAFSVDDWLAVAAQILFIIFSVYEITGVHYGTGQHNSKLSTEDFSKAMQMWWTCEPLYVLTNMFIKASIAIFLLRICVQRAHVIAIWIVTGITEVYSLFFFLLFILQCRPTSLFWLRYTADPPAGSCLDAKIVPGAFYGYSIISCITDWTLSILPVFMVWNLQMNKRVKISVILILAAGAIASSATIVRLPYLHTLTDIDDFLYSTSDVAIWSTVETGLGISAAGFATLRPLLRVFLGGGSSAQAGDTSGRQWHRTGSGKNATTDIFELGDRSDKRMGNTTIIEHDDNEDANDSKLDLEGQKARDNGSETSDARVDDWNSSQSDLAITKPTRSANPWSITVKKSVVQTRDG